MYWNKYYARYMRNKKVKEGGVKYNNYKYFYTKKNREVIGKEMYSFLWNFGV